jgi:hypothetical protein
LALWGRVLETKHLTKINIVMTKKKDSIVGTAILILFCGIMITYTGCKKNTEEVINNDSFALSNSTLKQFEFGSLILKGITLKEKSYKAYIGEGTIQLSLDVDKLCFIVPKIPPGAYKLKAAIDNNNISFPINIVASEIIQEPASYFDSYYQDLNLSILQFQSMASGLAILDQTNLSKDIQLLNDIKNTSNSRFQNATKEEQVSAAQLIASNREWINQLNTSLDTLQSSLKQLSSLSSPKGAVQDYEMLVNQSMKDFRNAVIMTISKIPNLIAAAILLNTTTPFVGAVAAGILIGNFIYNLVELITAENHLLSLAYPVITGIALPQNKTQLTFSNKVQTKLSVNGTYRTISSQDANSSSSIIVSVVDAMGSLKKGFNTLLGWLPYSLSTVPIDITQQTNTKTSVHLAHAKYMSIKNISNSKVTGSFQNVNGESFVTFSTTETTSQNFTFDLVYENPDVSSLTKNLTAIIEFKEPASVTIVSGNNQTGILGQVLTNPIKVVVKDDFGNPFQGAKVNFTASNGGSVSNIQITTGVDGTASVTWTLGSASNNQTVTVTVFKSDGTTPLQGSPLTFSATTNEPNSIAKVSGDNQTGTLGQILSNPIKVIVKDLTGAVSSGAIVKFTANNGGSVSNAQIITGVDGTASVTWTLGSSANTQTLTVTSFKSDGTTPLQGSPLTFTATVNVVANSIEKVSGDNQTGTPGQQLSNPVKIIVKDLVGNPVAGAMVNFTAGNGGSVSQSQVTTGENGIASAVWTLGSLDITQTLVVSAFKINNTTPLLGSPLTFTATANASNSLTKVSGDNQTGKPGSQLANLITVIAKDALGNPLGGTKVNFIVNNGGSVSNSTQYTGADGLASVTWTLGSTNGTQTLNVSAFYNDGITSFNGSPLIFSAQSIYSFMSFKINNYQILADNSTNAILSSGKSNGSYGTTKYIQYFFNAYFDCQKEPIYAGLQITFEEQNINCSLTNIQEKYYPVGVDNQNCIYNGIVSTYSGIFKRTNGCNESTGIGGLESGGVTITKITNSYIEGTFNFQGKMPGGSGLQTITDGSFRVPVNF